MFPFKAKQFEFNTELTIDQLQSRLSTNIRKWKLISISQDGQWYGIVTKNKATIELGQAFLKNSFRPVIVFGWTKSNSITKITGYYRVALSVITTSSLIPLFGLYLTIKTSNLLPFIFLFAGWTIAFTTFARWSFNKDLKCVEREFFDLLKT